MATATQTSLNFTDHGVTTTIPDDDVARLMYYLHSVTIGVGLDILQDDLVAYKQYYSLSPARIALVFKSAVEFSPDEFIGKLIFRDDEGEVIETGVSNKFVTISADTNIVSFDRNVVIAGKVRNVQKVMFFKSSWLKTYYTDPLERIARAILGTKHCTHCEGDEGLCSCTTCPRNSESQCRPLFDVFLNALTGPSSPPARTPTPQPKPVQLDPNQHQANCDGCGWRTFTGSRYKCTVCDDFDLCQPCYNRNVHDLWHPFMKIDTPGGKPVYLTARAMQAPSRTTPLPSPTPASPPPPPPLPRRTADPNPPPPPPYSPGDGRDATSSDFFYETMSPSDLKGFLKERGVSFEDILDKETLCRRVWETHCDCMSMSELNKFLTDNNISTTDCRDIASRRQKAKNAFKPPTRPVAPPASADTSSVRFRRDDNVVLKGLSRADMNGKKGVVLSVDQAAGKAQIRVDELDKTFKVKFENLTMFGEDDDEELE